MCSYKYWETHTYNDFSVNDTADAQQARTFHKNEQRKILYKALRYQETLQTRPVMNESNKVLQTRVFNLKKLDSSRFWTKDDKRRETLAFSTASRHSPDVLQQLQEVAQGKAISTEAAGGRSELRLTTSELGAARSDALCHAGKAESYSTIKLLICSP